MELSDIDFLIIGATKSATTWLQRSLQLDPSVYMPDPELHYFSREYSRGHDWYLAQFDPSHEHEIIGEKSNSYLDEPHAAARIHEALPDARLLAQLRNPVDRAYSDYCMLYRRGEVGRNISDHLDPRHATDGRFLSGGLYYRQLQTYLDLYPEDQLLVLLYEDLMAEPETQLDRVREFIGATSQAPSTPFATKVKDKSTPTIHPTLKKKLQILKPAVAPYRENHLFKTARGLIAKSPDYPPLTCDLRKRLGEFYAPEQEKLGSLLNRDLSVWSN
jgi:hypothetical protein